MKRVGKIDGVEVGVEWRDGGQIIVAQWPVGKSGGMTWLMNVLSDGQPCGMETRDSLVRTEVQHTDEVDRRIMGLIDLLIDVRMLHPTMVQLKLVLGEGEGEELLEALGG